MSEKIVPDYTGVPLPADAQQYKVISDRAGMWPDGSRIFTFEWVYGYNCTAGNDGFAVVIPNGVGAYNHGHYTTARSAYELIEASPITPEELAEVYRSLGVQP